MPPNTTEKHIQKNIVELLKSLGFEYIPSDRIDNFKEKRSDIKLTKILKSQLEKINSFVYKGKRYKFTPNTIERAIKDIDIFISGDSLAEVNQQITEMLRFGRSYEQFLDDGSKRSFSFKFIDFRDIENNHFAFTQEFVAENKRIDLNLFINGLPLVFIELKASNVESKEGISQMIRNQKENPNIFKFSQILIAGNPNEPKYATTKTPLKFYSIWREDIDLEFKDRSVTNLDRLVVALLKKERLLEIIKSFIIFDGGVKKITRYQQYFGIEKILEKIEKKERGGVIWHTQGSGKSLTMVMLTKLLKERFVTSKVVVVTDRKALDRQITDVFRSSDIEVKRAKSARDLISLLEGGSSVVTTLVHKFEGVANRKIEIDERVFILVDESHRTQGGELHKAMKNVFKNGIYLAFTGTPLLKSEKSTYKKFGGEIHRYTIDEAVRDEAVLPLLYESRFIEQSINDKKGLDIRFERLTKDLNESEIADLKRKWARFNKIASSSRRLEVIAYEIENHFNKFLKDTPFNAMLATSSKYDALKYKNIFDTQTNIKSAVVISPPDMREGEEDFNSENRNFVIREYKKIVDSGNLEDEVKERFKNGEIELLIVVDKLLTGFDAPRARVLYIDKELKEHNLLQAIARVNRLYDGKDNGLIVDFRGLLGELDRALTNYSSLSGFDEEDLKGAVFDIREEIAKVKTLYTHLEELFKDVEFKDDMESYGEYLSDEKRRKLFYEYLLKFSKALHLALSSDKIDEVLNDEEIKEYRAKLKFYIKLRESVKIRYHERIDFKKYEGGMQKILDTFLSASDDVIEVVEPVNIFEAEFDRQVERLTSKSAKADAILSGSIAFIRENFEKNPSLFQKLSKRIEDILDDYRYKRLSEEEKLKEALKIREELLKENRDNYPKEINSNLKKALFDNLKDDFEKLNLDNEVLIESVLKVTEIFKIFSKKPDWKETKRKEIAGEIEDILYEIEDEFNIEFDLNKITPKIIGVGVANG